MVPLVQISKGFEVSLQQINLEEDELQQRLAELGIFEGMRVSVDQNRSHSSTVIISYAGTQLVLSKKVAEKILVV